MLECVIFDLDGLMVDSEPLQYRAYRDAFAHYGFELSLSQWTQWRMLEASPRRWVEASGLPIDSEELRTRKKLIYDQMIATELTLKPGVVTLVDELAASYRLSVASGSRHESIYGCLERFSLLHHFDHLCSATAVERSKPYPDVYLHALGLLQADASATVALEDSPTGLAAATAADIRCVVCPDPFLPTPADAYADASLLVESLTQLDANRLEQLVLQPYDDGLHE
ncbi:MAG: HAD family phosphatase [Gammaproteobacteria bacterium]|nr:MAG: HAD family phosphatase [Gammaproteobacteria bacterium]